MSLKRKLIIAHTYEAQISIKSAINIFSQKIIYANNNSNNNNKS